MYFGSADGSPYIGDPPMADERFFIVTGYTDNGFPSARWRR